MNSLYNTYPNTFTPIQIHTTSDAYSCTWGNARWSFYYHNGFGTPCAEFDGDRECLGAYTNNQQQYNWYYSYGYVPSLSHTTDVVIAVGGEQLSGQTYRITVRVSIEATGTGKTMTIQVVNVLDHWPTADVNHRNCAMNPAMASQSVTLAPGQMTEFTRDITFNATSWARQSNIKIVAFAQTTASHGPAQVYNAARMDWPFSQLPPLYTVGDTNCDGSINAFDIDPFIMALTSPSTYAQQYPNCDILSADANGDGVVNAFDIDPFILCLTSGCP